MFAFLFKKKLKNAPQAIFFFQKLTYYFLEYVINSNFLAFFFQSSPFFINFVAMSINKNRHIYSQLKFWLKKKKKIKKSFPADTKI